MPIRVEDASIIEGGTVQQRAVQAVQEAVGDEVGGIMVVLDGGESIHVGIGTGNRLRTVEGASAVLGRFLRFGAAWVEMWADSKRSRMKASRRPRGQA